MVANETNTVIIYLTGKPGIGKYTIAKELSKHGFIVCDNQLINNPIFALLNYDGLTSIPDFAWDKIGRIRDIILDFLACRKENNYVLTNNLYDDEGDRNLYEQVKQMAKTRGSLFVPVRFSISEEEHLKRITQPERRKRWKSIDPSEILNRAQLLHIKHHNLLELDVSNLDAVKVAEKILKHVEQCI